MPPKPIVHIIDDDEAIRQALVFMMKPERFQVREYASAQAFLSEYEAGADGCIVTDVRMPGMSGLELQDTLIARGIHVPVIIMTGHGDVDMAVKSMKAGAFDFILKPYRNEELLGRIRECVSQSVEMSDEEKRQSETTERLSLLTAREREIMDLLVEGKLNKVIAAELNISVRTVESHRAKILNKLQVRSLSDLVRISLLA